MFEHLFIGAMYGFVVVVPILVAMLALTRKFTTPIMDKTVSTKEGKKKMILPGIGLVITFVLFAVAIQFMSSDTFSDMRDAMIAL